MIQQIHPRQNMPAAAAAARHAHSGAPEIWGQWSGRKHYSLEVVQHPLRARMCGFGDKDRRPLAPAAVAKMIVRREDNTIVDVDEVDCSFFVAIVDLWSADAENEMNLVLHPSSADRYVPPSSASKTARRRGASTSAPHHRSSGNQTPTGRSTPTPSQYRTGDNPAGGATTPLSSSGYNNQSISDSLGFPATNPYATPSSEPTPTTWGYPLQAPPLDRNSSYPPPLLPSIHSFGRNSASAPNEPWGSENHSDMGPYRAWNAEPPYSPVDSYNSQVDPALRHSSASDSRENSAWSQQPDSYGGSAADHSVYGSAQYSSHQSSSYQPSSYSAHPESTPSGTSSHSGSRHSYTRTLVGPLSASACRLLDEHRKPGIFFLFQDLSVRTEGTFRLRIRLMNVGAPPAPEAGATRVHNDVSLVLAQTFTNQFIVFSAKRFPGVPDTTALSIAFGNQGQKLPLRNRHGSKRRRRGHSESDDDDSDGA